MPVFCDGNETVFEAKGIGHPLLTGKRTHNDLVIDNKVKVLLITGSNMSGKSTLLRTAGINLVLAYAGAPVCASWFQASIMGINTCMRIGDNLGENISSFYAELLRIKKIVTEAAAGKRIFYLLDEIFKGTNSLDRHTGAKVLINKLSHTNCIGLVSTHDLELCELERENDRIANYHFQEYYKNGRIYFDYELRPGPSTTRNALYLMQLAGIDVDENTIVNSVTDQNSTCSKESG
jgi:DNA mismatch repair ATPase MutS